MGSLAFNDESVDVSLPLIETATYPEAFSGKKA
jgi:hypothetical protein